MQIHDFNPGFGPEVSPVGSNGFGTRTFWTAAIPDSDVTVHFGAGTAEMRVDNLALGDFGTKANALGKNWQTASDPAVVSFDVVWSGPVFVGAAKPLLSNGVMPAHVADQLFTNLESGLALNGWVNDLALAHQK